MKAPFLALALTLVSASAFAQSDVLTPGYGPDSNPILQQPGTTAEVETPINNLRARLMDTSPGVCIADNAANSEDDSGNAPKLNSPYRTRVTSDLGPVGGSACR